MSIEFNCGSCAKLLRVPEGSEGKQAKCPHCSQVVRVPKVGGAQTKAPGPPQGGSGGPPAGKPSSPPSSSPSSSPGAGAGAGPAPIDDDPLGLGGIPPGATSPPQPHAPNPYASSAAHRAAPQQSKGSFSNPGAAPHRGALVLTLGIISVSTSTLAYGGFVACCCGAVGMVFAICSAVISGIGIGCGIPAWVMGKNDIQAMNGGSMDFSGMGLTRGGYITGIIGVVLGAIQMTIVIFWVVIIILGITAFGFGASGY